MSEVISDRGYACIGLYHPTKTYNIGHALRAAGCFGAKLIAVSNAKYSDTMTDTQRTYKHIPLLEVDDLRQAIPHDCTPVAIELVEGAKSLPEFIHPERAFYIFGPELGVVDESVLAYCQDVVSIPTKFCLNLGACINVVLYDRMSKRLVNAKHVENRRKVFSRIR